MVVFTGYSLFPYRLLTTRIIVPVVRRLNTFDVVSRDRDARFRRRRNPDGARHINYRVTTKVTVHDATNNVERTRRGSETVDF